MATLSKINTKPQDIEAFHSERNIMLQEKRNFKFGSAVHGLAALNSLQSMYTVFIFPEHCKEPKQPSPQDIKSEFVQLRNELIEYIKIHTPQNEKEEKAAKGRNLNNEKYRAIMDKFDELEMQIIKIKTEVGL